MRPNVMRRIKTLLGFILAAVVILVMIVPIYISTKPEYGDTQVYQLEHGWDVVAHGQLYEDVEIASYLFPMFDRGDEIFLDYDIPEDVNVDNPELMFYTVHSVVEVFLDGELVYEYGMEGYSQGKLIGYGYNYVELPDDFAGKHLSMHYVVTENDAFEGITAIEIHDASDFMRVMLAEQRINILITAFLMLFGVIGMILSLVMIFREMAFSKTFCISAFAFLVSCWTFCNGDVITLFVEELRVKVFLEYTTFYLMTLPFIGYFFDNFQNKTLPKVLRGYYHVVFVGDVLFILMVFVLQWLNLCHFPAFVSVEHVIMLLSMLVIFAAAISDAQMKHTLFTPFGFGFAIAIIIAAVELARYNLSKYVVGFPENKYNSHMQIAALVIVITLIMDFCEKVTTHLYEEAQTKLLERMAYMDELTSLANRRKCEEAMENRKGAYGIVSLDMNGLKIINDTYGHEVGDRALRAFSKCLEKAFPENATVGRMGGDEFIAIVPTEDRGLIDGYVAELNRLIAEYNEKNVEKFVLSAAWGVSMGSEKDHPHEIYSNADTKMYECKRLMKKNMQYT